MRHLCQTVHVILQILKTLIHAKCGECVSGEEEEENREVLVLGDDVIVPNIIIDRKSGNETSDKEIIFFGLFWEAQHVELKLTR